ncbi:hypothetical protein B0H21DRAFT_725575 [Amylocystis lapponica]|nr:hypothetical protein B0H21DRAFT_725575 [Amylocystis lapponica]
MWPWCLSPVRVAGGWAMLHYLGEIRACSSVRRALRQPVQFVHNSMQHDEESQPRIHVSPAVVIDVPFVYRIDPLAKSDTTPASQQCECGVASMSLSASHAMGTTTIPLMHDRTVPADSLSMLGGTSRVRGRAMFSKEAGIITDTGGDNIPNGVASDASALQEKDQRKLSRLLLRQLLSEPVTIPPSPIRFGTRRLRVLYASIKTRSMLHLLSSADQSALVSLFGSLSLSTSKDPYLGIFGHPFTPHMRESSFRNSWSFVVQLAKDKRRLGRTLSHSDRYWLMQAYLAELQTPGKEMPTDLQPVSAERSLQLARHQYHHIYRYSSDFNIHYPYLKALIAQHPTSANANEVIPRLCELLVRYDTCNPRLLVLLWQIVLQPLSPPYSLRQTILLALWNRQCGSDDTTSLHSHGQLGISDNSDLLRRLANVIRVHSVGVSDLAVYLRHAVFSRQLIQASSDSTHHLLTTWAQSTTKAVLEPELGTAQSRWDSVVLLALFSSPLGSGGRDVVADRRHGTWSVEVADWHVICVLGSLEKLFPSVDGQSSASSGHDIVRGVSRVLETLWNNWIAAVDERRYRPLFVSRAICAAFLRLAGHVKNKTLSDACRQYCDCASLWAVVHSDGSSSLGLNSLAREHLLSSLTYGGRVETALAFIMECVHDPETLSTVVNATISRLCHVDVDVAQRLWASSRHMSIDISPGTIVILGVMLSRQGLHTAALQHLNDIRLTTEQRLQIVRPLLLVLSRYRHRKVSPHLAEQIGDVLLGTFSSQTPHVDLRHTLENVCLVISRSGHPSKAVALVEAICSRHSSFFRQSLFRLLVRLLLSQRQFRLAERVFDLSAKLLPQLAQSMKPQLMFQYSRAGASRLALRLAQSTPEGRVGILDALSLACTKHLTRPSVARTLSLKVQRVLNRQQANAGLSTQYALHLLLRTGRVRAAKRIYEQAQEQPQRVRTMMGNDILHASMLHRSRGNARRMRKVLDTLNDFVKRTDFVPDGVTVNVLLKALMWWTTDVDSQKLRVLFDRMVQNGYPSGDIATGGGLPFGTEGAHDPEGFVIPKTKSGISFARHVRPLYKMFIRAFYIRGDATAARTVVRILKAAREEAVERLERQERAIVAGRRKSLSSGDELSRKHE